MLDDWLTVSLGEVLEPAGETWETPREGEVCFAGVRLHGGGVYVASSSPGAEVKAKRLSRLIPRAFIYNRMWATRGSFAVVPDTATDLWATNEYPQFSPLGDRLDVDYLALLSQQPSFLEQVDAMSVGSTDRRRLHPNAFLELEIELPPIGEQQEIVAAVGTLLNAEWASQREAAAADQAHCAGRIALIELAASEPVPLGELVLGIEGGKSPKCLDRPPVDREFGVLKVSSIRDGLFRPDEAKALPPGIDPWQQTVEAGDLLYSRANTSALVGALCRVEVDHPHLLLCDKTMRIRVDRNRLDPNYLVEAMGAPSAREHIELMAGGTSDSMKNISQKAYLETEIALVPLELQRTVVRRLLALRRISNRAQEVAGQIGRLRAALVEELLMGNKPVRFASKP